jgi:hypothetical protein
MFLDWNAPMRLKNVDLNRMNSRNENEKNSFWQTPEGEAVESCNSLAFAGPDPACVAKRRAFPTFVGAFLSALRLFMSENAELRCEGDVGAS